MTAAGNTPVKDHHRCRRAVAYVRQSSEEQAKSNTGSTDYQRGQVRFAKALGWPDELIDVVEDDLGLSGTAAAHRHGYLRIKEAIQRREIGAVLIADHTRLGRDSEEWSAFLRICRLYEVLLIIDGKVHDPCDNSELLIAKMLATLGEYDNLLRREHLQRGRLTKARKGHTVSQPPCGYLRRKKTGNWVKHPSRAVQAAVLAVFRIFLEVGSCPKTVRALIERGIMLPSHLDGARAVRWSRPQLGRVYSMLSNPAYAGTYAYRRRISDPTLARDRRGRLRSRQAKPHEQFLIERNHEPYVSQEDWQRVQTLLRLNAPSPDRRNLGPGHGLIQGIIGCALHSDRAMSTAYTNAPPNDGSRPHSYYCIGDFHHGGKQCGHVAGRAIDHAVLTAVFAHLSAPPLQAIKAAFRKLRGDLRSEQYRRQIELNRLRNQVTDLEYRYLSVDPTNVHVKATLENKFEQATRDLRQAEQCARNEYAPLDALTEDAFDELVALCADLPALLQDPTVTSLDRKQVLRLLIDRVLVGERSATHVRIRVRWRGGAPDTSIDVPRKAYARHLIAEWTREGKRPAEIADELNRQGCLSNRVRPWTEMAVQCRIRRLRRHGNLPPPEKDGA